MSKGGIEQLLAGLLNSLALRPSVRAPELMSRLLAEQSKVSERLAVLERELRARPSSRPATLYDLDGGDVHLLQPVQVVVDEYPDEVIAAWPEVGARGSGVNEGEAILALKRDIADLASELLAFDDSELGELLLSQKRALGRVVATGAAR